MVHGIVLTRFRLQIGIMVLSVLLTRYRLRIGNRQPTVLDHLEKKVVFCHTLVLVGGGNSI